jgi:hypothetical protein
MSNNILSILKRYSFDVIAKESFIICFSFKTEQFNSSRPITNACVVTKSEFWTKQIGKTLKELVNDIIM